MGMSLVFNSCNILSHQDSARMADGGSVLAEDTSERGERNGVEVVDEDGTVVIDKTML